MHDDILEEIYVYPRWAVSEIETMRAEHLDLPAMEIADLLVEIDGVAKRLKYDRNPVRREWLFERLELAYTELEKRRCDDRRAVMKHDAPSAKRFSTFNGPVSDDVVRRVIIDD